MLNMESILQAVDGLSQDEVRQLYNYLVENHLQLNPGDGHPGAARMGDDFGYEWSGEFWVSEE
ncbi:MAG: hypothetical protein HZC41_21090 [Chloroflexi bacterium]|nr:hypothetical protein [Chloroflexota bacterium]